MRFAVAFALTVAVVGVVGILVAHEYATQLDRLWAGVTEKLGRAMRQ